MVHIDHDQDMVISVYLQVRTKFNGILFNKGADYNYSAIVFAFFFYPERG